SRFAPLSNWLAVKSLAGVDPRRSLPVWKRQTFAQWFARNSNGVAGKPVTLFNDTFINHYDPEIGVAAVRVLRRGGCAVNVVRPGCCGRPLISQGLLAEARAQAEKIVDGLLPIAKRGGKILFLE